MYVSFLSKIIENILVLWWRAKLYYFIRKVDQSLLQMWGKDIAQIIILNYWKTIDSCLSCYWYTSLQTYSKDATAAVVQWSQWSQAVVTRPFYVAVVKKKKRTHHSLLDCFWGFFSMCLRKCLSSLSSGLKLVQSIKHNKIIKGTKQEWSIKFELIKFWCFLADCFQKIACYCCKDQN